MVHYNLNFVDRQYFEQTETETRIERECKVNLGNTIYDDAFVLPSKELWKDGKCLGGVVTDDGEFVVASGWHEGKRCDKYEFEKEKAIKYDNTIIWMGFLNPAWGHAITDGLKKLWFLDTEECKQYTLGGAKFAYITTGNVELPEYVKELYALADVNIEEWIHITELSQWKKVIVPDNSFIADKGDRYFTDAYRKTINKITSKITPDESHSKVYFSRTRLNDPRDYGEKKLEDVFRKAGYQIVAPETFSIEQQLSILRGCMHFAATEGSVSHNIVFCQPHINVTILRKVHDVNKYQLAVNAVVDANVTIVDAHKSTKANPLSPWGGPFYMCVNENVRKALGIKGFVMPLWLRPSWWWYNMYYSSFFQKNFANRRFAKQIDALIKRQ